MAGRRGGEREVGWEFAGREVVGCGGVDVIDIVVGEMDVVGCGSGVELEGGVTVVVVGDGVGRVVEGRDVGRRE